MIVERLVKRSAEGVTYDIDCSRMLPAGVIATGVPEMTAYPVTQPPLAFGVPAVQGSAVVYDDHTAPSGTVIRVKISGGTVAAPLPHQDYWVRAKFTDSVGDVREATVPLRVDDTP